MSDLANGSASIALIVMAMCFAVLSTAEAQEVPLQKCQQIKDQIERYDELRRQGGRAGDMDSWKRQRREKEGEFRSFGCHDYQELR